MTTMPTYNFVNLGITEADFQKLEAESQSYARLQPGEHELEVVYIESKGPAIKDPTWFKFSVRLSTPGAQAIKNAEGKVSVRIGESFAPVIYHTVLVPTSKILYNEQNSKKPTAVFAMLREFYEALGENLTVDSVSTLIPKYFGQEPNLLGKKIKVTLGYRDVHIEHRDGAFIIADKTGAQVGNKTFASKDLAIGEGLILGYEQPLNDMLSVLKFHPAPVSVSPAQEPSDDWD